MPSLHEAVARAIAPYIETGQFSDRRRDLAATAAIRVCLAEAQRAVEALPRWGGYTGYPQAASPEGEWVRVAPVLAVLAALAEEQDAS